MKHSLLEKDPATRRGRCSVDGDVRIQKSGTGWVCGARHNANARASKARHPERDKTSKTEHVLTWRNPETGTGLCAVCEVVEIVVWGRGYACPNGDAAKLRTNHQAKPATYCDACKLLDGDVVWLRADGCPRCNETDLNAMLAQDEADRRLMGDVAEEFDGGFMVTGAWADPYEMPDLECAVPGWKTIA